MTVPTSDPEIIICAGAARPDDVHLASTIHCIDGEIIHWLAKRERRKELNHASQK